MKSAVELYLTGTEKFCASSEQGPTPHRGKKKCVSRHILKCDELVRHLDSSCVIAPWFGEVARGEEPNPQPPRHSRNRSYSVDTQLLTLYYNRPRRLKKRKSRSLLRRIPLPPLCTYRWQMALIYTEYAINRPCWRNESKEDMTYHPRSGCPLHV